MKIHRNVHIYIGSVSTNNTSSTRRIFHADCTTDKNSIRTRNRKKLSPRTKFVVRGDRAYVIYIYTHI